MENNPRILDLQLISIFLFLLECSCRTLPQIPKPHELWLLGQWVLRLNITHFFCWRGPVSPRPARFRVCAPFRNLILRRPKLRTYDSLNHHFCSPNFIFCSVRKLKRINELHSIIWSVIRFHRVVLRKITSNASDR